MNRRCASALIFLLLLQVSATGRAAWDDLIERFATDAVVKPAAPRLSQADLVAGLKEALLKGSRTAVNTLGRDNGFFNHPQLKIPLPEKLQGAEAALRAIGQGRIADDFVLSMNRAAERAVPKAGAIFTSAIQSMSIRDAYGILTGADDAATAYLKEALNESILDSSEHARRKCDFHLASKSMTCVIDFVGTSLCRTESLIQSEIP